MVYTQTMSKTAYKLVGEVLRELKLHHMVHLRIQDLAHIVAPKLRGWINYYGRFSKVGLKRAMRFLNMRLLK